MLHGIALKACKKSKCLLHTKWHICTAEACRHRLWVGPYFFWPPAAPLTACAAGISNTTMANVQIDASWKAVLQPAFATPDFQQATLHVKTELAAGKTIYPPGRLIFNAFNSTPFGAVKAVILGQDPYHGPGQAMGLSFSVPKGIKPPPSLVNMFKELQTDIGMVIPGHGDLSAWAAEGVLLLNAALTVRAHEPNSHAQIGWHTFTDRVIQALSDGREHIAFLLWGKFAQDKAALIDATRHLVLKAAHPSPFSADKGFFGCRHFSRTNAWLAEQGIAPINWHLAP